MQGVDVGLVLLNDRSVVNNGLFVATELGEAVCTVVEGLDVVRSALGVLLAVFDLISVVLDGQLVPLELSVDEASIGIDDWVSIIELDGFVEILD